MFGSDQMAILQQMQQAMEESRKRLDSVTVSGEAGGGLIRIELSGNRELRSLEIRTELSGIEKEDLEDLLSVALKKALEAANSINENEVASSAGRFFPGFQP